jgi:cytochrome c
MKHVLAIFTLSLALTSGAATGHAEGDAEKGADKFFERCYACHTVDQGGANKVGPNLFGVFGTTAGKRVFSFERRHSTAIKESQIVWNDETLDGFLEDPGKYLPGTRMTFVGFRKKPDRDNIIAYLKTLAP